MTTFRLIAVRFCLFIALLSSASGQPPFDRGDEEPRDPIEVASNKAGGFGNQSPFKLQFTYRMANLSQIQDYRFADKDAPRWKRLMEDTAADEVGRICAAYFLAERDKTARQFLETEAKSDNLERRYNAALAISSRIPNASTRDWAIQTSLQLLESGLLDGLKPGEDAGHNTILYRSPIDSVCRALGETKDTRAVEPLIALLKRRPDRGEAAGALGVIGDPRALPILMSRLQENKGELGWDIQALAAFRHRPAAAVLAKHLENRQRQTRFGDFHQLILEALLEIGDPTVSTAIREFIKREPLKLEFESRDRRPTARRVLVQLEQKDPAPSLIKLYQYEKDKYDKADLIRDLANYENDESLGTLSKIAQSSNSSLLRREAIFGIAVRSDKKSYKALANLLTIEFPDDLEDNISKLEPMNAKYFLDLVAMLLERNTGMKFGLDAMAWQAWIDKQH